MKLKTLTRSACLLIATTLCALPTLAASDDKQTSSKSAQEVLSDGLREVNVEQKSFSLGGTLPSWVETRSIPETISTEPAVTRLADTQFWVSEKPLVYVHRAIQANDPAMLNSLGQIQIDFVPDYQKLTLLAVRVHRGKEVHDRTKSVSVRFLQRETGLEQGIYSGAVTVLVVVSDLRVSDTVDFEYYVEGQNPVFGHRFDDFASWDMSSPTEYRRVSINHPAARKIRWQVLGGNAEGITTQRRSIGSRIQLTFEQRKLKAITPQPDAPADFAQFRSIQFSEYENWEQVADWARNLFPKPVIAEDLKQIIDRLTVQPTEERRIMAALEFVQSDIRYFSVSLGESSHRPTPPTDVLKRRYGDCKDKSYLLVTLLREMGITAQPVLVNISAGKGIDQLLPSPLDFNHVIVQVLFNGQYYYLDPTRSGQYGKLNKIGHVHAGSKALVIADGIRSLTDIPYSKEQDYASERLETAEIPTFEGNATLSVKQTWRGLKAELLRITFAQMSREQINTGFSSIMEKRYNGIALKGDVTLSDDREENVLSAQASFTAPKFAELDGDRWFVRYRPSNFIGLFSFPATANRTAPVSIPSHPARERYVFEAHFPESVSMQIDPGYRAIKNKHFNFETSSSFRGNRARVALTVETFTDRVLPEEIHSFQNDIDTLSKAASGVIIVPKRAIKSTGFLESAKSSLADTLAEQARQRIVAVGKAISSGKLSGEDLARAHCDRGIALSEIGDDTEGLKDVAESVRIAPNSAEMLQCQAEVFFNAGQFQKSVASYSRALSLTGSSSSTYYRRGVSRYFLGQFATAVEDLQKALDSNDESEALYAALWLTWSSQQAKMPVPETARNLAARKTDGDWPRPALAMLNGLTSPEALGQYMARFKGDEGQMMRAEGFFYLGQHYLLKGDIERARSYFEKCREQGIINYIEHPAAKFELNRLTVKTKP